ncbi:glycoside hydrolase family 53 protein [Namhaeicola litoreus]|uniref:Arabinogalactan endo-beta-1,4-galactanase n=1 Tax=Namhaeicola litoreus TaxID=1052145 RepID=A0ABW3Y4B3_9FLAO
MDYYRSIFLVLFFISLISCSEGKDEVDQPLIMIEKKMTFRGADLSAYPQIASRNLNFLNHNSDVEDFLSILKKSGVNIIRLKLWVNPTDRVASLSEVEDFSTHIRSKGYQIWLTLHYSDTWADPGHQEKPKAWQNISYEQLKDSVREYTKKVVATLRPEIIQIGNEINNGFLFPDGNLHSNEIQCIELLQIASEAVRQTNAASKIMIHYAGHSGSNSFFQKMANVDYDFIGLSYYPIWHGKDLNTLAGRMNELSNSFGKQLLIAETAYPFTLGWNDYTNNIVGLESQIILPDFPPTGLGQANFFKALYTKILEVEDGIGICYWGGELVAFDGPTSQNGSPWENQALFDFTLKSLPILKEFNPQK